MLPLRLNTTATSGQGLAADAFERRLPLFGTIELTRRCNLRCRHCYLSRAERATGASMDPAFLNRLLDSLARAGCVVLTLTGGEILAASDFERMYRAVVDRGFLVKLQTNATAVRGRAAELIEQLPPAEVSVSLYGAQKESYEWMTGVSGSYAAFRRSLDRLREAGIKLSFVLTVTRLSLPEYERLREMAAEYAAEFKPSFYLAPAGDGSGFSLTHRLQPQDVARIEFQDPLTLRKFIDLRRGYASGRLSVSNAFNCRAGMTSFFVDSDGRLQLCAHMTSPSFDLRRKDFDDTWAEDVLQLRMMKRSSPLPGAEGGAYRFLSMQCPARSLAYAGEAEKPVPYLSAIFKARLKQWHSMEMDDYDERKTPDQRAV